MSGLRSTRDGVCGCIRENSRPISLTWVSQGRAGFSRLITHLCCPRATVDSQTLAIRICPRVPPTRACSRTLIGGSTRERSVGANSCVESRRSRICGRKRLPGSMCGLMLSSVLMDHTRALQFPDLLGKALGVGRVLLHPAALLFSDAGHSNHR